MHRYAKLCNLFYQPAQNLHVNICLMMFIQNFSKLLQELAWHSKEGRKFAGQREKQPVKLQLGQ